MQSFRLNLDRALEADRRFGLAAGMADSPGKFFACGDFVLEALTGREPGGMLIACGADTIAFSSELARRAGLEPHPIKNTDGAFHLTGPGIEDKAESGVTVVPLAGDISTHLSDSGFSVQALALDLAAPRPREVIDPHGGLADLRSGTLRASHPGSFTDDPARLLVAADLTFRFGLNVDAGTGSAMKAAAPRVSLLEPYRAWRHVARLFGGSNLSEKAAFLQTAGVLGELLPELAAVYGVPQNYYHHLGVWEHTLEVMDNLEAMLDKPETVFKAFGHRVSARMAQVVEGGIDRRAYIGFASLVHDVGKSETMSVTSSGRIRFQGHQEVGGRMAGNIAGRFGLGRKGSRHLAHVVADHMRLGFLMKEGESAETRLRVVEELGERTVEVVLLSLADRMATRGEASTREAMDLYRRMSARVLHDYFWDIDYPPLVSGRDVVVHAGVEPGPQVGRALFMVRVAQREAVVAGRRQALEFMAPDFKGRMDLPGLRAD